MKRRTAPRITRRGPVTIRVRGIVLMAALAMASLGVALGA